jgi:hypothetical protein
LAAGKLSDLLPELWGTESAAEAWLRKNRLNRSISIIRLWAVSVDYKPKRQRRWSKALVRHGADPRQAIAEVLGGGRRRMCGGTVNLSGRVSRMQATAGRIGNL